MTYITFGEDHAHVVNNITFDKNCVAAIPSNNRTEGRHKAFDLFNIKWCFEYFDREFKREDLKYFPRGIINVENGDNIDLS